VTSALSVETDIANFILELSAYYQVTGGTMKSHFEVVADGSAGGLSAFDVAGPGGPRTTLINWFNSNQMASINNALPMLGASIHNITTTIASIWNENMGTTLVTVSFSDGSQVTLSYEAINATINVVPGSAKDKYGNVIPANGEELDGTRFDYSLETPNGPAFQRMQSYLSLFFNISISNGARRWACVQVDGGTWNCQYI